MEEHEVARLVQSLLAGIRLQVEIAEVASVVGATATVKRQGQTAATRALPVAVGLNVAAGERVILLRPGGDLNAAVIVAKLTGQGLVAATASNSDTVDNIHFRVNAGVLQWSQDGLTWTNA